MDKKQTPDNIRLLLAMGFLNTQPVQARLAPGNEMGMEAVAFTNDGATVFSDARDHDVDVVILCPEIKNFDSEVIQRLHHYDPKPIITIGAVSLTSDWAVTMERAGAKGHINLPFTDEKVEKLLAMIPSLLKEAYQDRASSSYIPRIDTELAESLARRGFQRRTVASWAPKGGVGKTFLLTNLGALLGIIANRPTLIIDADMNGGDVFAYLSHEFPTFKRNIFSLAEEFSLDGALTPQMLKRNITHYQGNLDVLVGIARMHQSGVKSMIGGQGERFGQAVMETAERLYDFVLVDLGSDYNHPLHMRALMASDLTLLVVTPNVISRYHARNCRDDLMDTLGMPAERFQLVVNKFLPDVGVTRRQIQKDMALPEVGIVPFDLDVFRSLNEGVPIVLQHPEEEVGRALAQIGETIYPPLEVIWRKRWKTRKGKGLLGRLFG